MLLYIILSVYLLLLTFHWILTGICAQKSKNGLSSKFFFLIIYSFMINLYNLLRSLILSNYFTDNLWYFVSVGKPEYF